MFRWISILLAVGLFILFVVGITQPATGWLAWLDGLGAVCALLIASNAGQAVVPSAVATPPVVLAICLGILWIAGIGTHAAAWQSWWTFGIACAFLILGTAGGIAARRTTRKTPPQPV